MSDRKDSARALLRSAGVAYDRARKGAELKYSLAVGKLEEEMKQAIEKARQQYLAECRRIIRGE